MYKCNYTQISLGCLSQYVVPHSVIISVMSILKQVDMGEGDRKCNKN